jgi:outer membrane lipoprotein-sorting protein
MMKRLLLAGAALALVCAGGCNKTATTNPDENAIRAALQSYLASRPGLNISAMDTNVKQVSVTGNTAQARVEFKAEAPTRAWR